MPLRRRLTLIYASFFAIALLVLDLALYGTVDRVLHGAIDNEIALGAKIVQQGFSDSNKTLTRYFNDQGSVFVIKGPTVGGFDGTNLMVQVFDRTSNEVVHSPNVPDGLPISSPDLAIAMQGGTVITTFTLQSAQMRELYFPLLLQNPVTHEYEVVGAVRIVRSLEETRRALGIFAIALISGSLVALVAAGLGGWWLTRAVFRPIDQIGATARSIVRAEDLSLRIPLPTAQDELQRLTITINEMLSRMDVVFSDQRRFIADVSHELRTPLAAMQGNLEVLGRGLERNPAGLDPQLLQESIVDMRRETARLIRMTNDLLLLARSDSGFEIQRAPVELDTLLLEVHRELRPLANGVQLQIGHEDQAVVNGDRDRIKQALLNLGINAIQHTAQGGSVTLGLDVTDDLAALTVSDSGVGIAAADLPHIFDRFFRVDPARNHNRGGSGLGLAIVRWVAEAHGGQISVHSQLGVGTTFTLRLPLERAAEPVV